VKVTVSVSWLTVGKKKMPYNRSNQYAGGYMSYRDDVREKIIRILETMPDETKAFERVIRQVYAQALEEAKRTGHSIESITYEVLEGVEEGMETAPHRIEEMLEKASLIMADILQHSAQEDIVRRYRRIIFAREALEETIEAEKRHMMESFDAFSAYAQTRGYRRFGENLYRIGSTMMQQIEKLVEEIVYNPKHS